MKKIKDKITQRLYTYENPKRKSISWRYPKLKKSIILIHQIVRDFQNKLNFSIRYHRDNKYFDNIVASHQSVLRRKLGDTNPNLQEKKIINLQLASQKLNGIIIQPGHIFSFWKIIGKPKYEDGYVDGMLISNGNIIEGIGGGLCQLSNFLYWIFLHAPVEIIERHHHSMDVFPDSDRTLPFGSGATILYNFIDLKLKNISPHPLQLKIWLTDNHLKGKILSPHNVPNKYHVFEKNHFIVKRKKLYYRYNEIYRETKQNGKIIKIDKIVTNFAPIVYSINDDYLKKNKFKILDL